MIKFDVEFWWEYFKDMLSRAKDIEGLEIVEKVEVTEDKRHLIHFKSGGDLDEKLSRILSILVEQGCKIRKYNLVTPSLDEVYVELIGGGQRLA